MPLNQRTRDALKAFEKTGNDFVVFGVKCCELSKEELCGVIGMLGSKMTELQKDRARLYDLLNHRK